MVMLLIKNLLLVAILLCWYCADRVVFKGSTAAFIATLILMVCVDLLFGAYSSRNEVKARADTQN